MPLCCFGLGFFGGCFFLKLFSIIKCFKNLPAIATKEKVLLIRFYMSQRGNKAKQALHCTSNHAHIQPIKSGKKKSNKAGFCLMKQRSKIVGDTAQIFIFSHPRLSLGGQCSQTEQLSRILVCRRNAACMRRQVLCESLNKTWVYSPQENSSMSFFSHK